MKKILLFFLFMSITMVYAQVPVEYYKNPSGIDIVMTSEFFVIENFDKSFVTGEIMIWGDYKRNEAVPMLSFIFDDYSSKNRGKNLLAKKTSLITIVFEDNTTLSTTASIREGFGISDPVCLDMSMAKFTQSGETTEMTLEMIRRNISIFTSKDIKRIEFDGGSLNVRSEAQSDPLLKSSSLIKSMFAELRSRYPNNPTLR